MIDRQALQTALQTVRETLLRERGPGGWWVGRLSASALSTATAVSALCLVRREAIADGSPDATRVAAALAPLIRAGLRYLLQTQNPDGGWGDTDRSYSNISTSLLVRAALRLAEAESAVPETIDRAERYIQQQGGTEAVVRRYGKDKTFSVPILSNAALAELVDWSEIPPLPFELAAVPQSLYRWVGMPVVSYAIPALVALGRLRFEKAPPANFLQRAIRHRATPAAMRVLRRMQPASGGYLEATPLTSFVLMSLAALGQSSHPVARDAVRFLVQSVRPDGSWPIDTNLATWGTTLSINALSAGDSTWEIPEPVLDWVLACQHHQPHPFTGAAPGGWGWTDLSGAVPDADDTPGALLTLARAFGQYQDNPNRTATIRQAARRGIDWLLGLQNRNGGWPTFVRGWGRLPFDRSSADLTAHALRALHAWQAEFAEPRIPRAIQRGWQYLEGGQRPDGSWLPLWFGNQDNPDEENPVYGTSRVLAAMRDLGRLESPSAHRAARALAALQNPDGGWGSAGATQPSPDRRHPSSVEETALALEGLAPFCRDEKFRSVTEKGTDWILRAVRDGSFREPAPIGFYFAKLWYYERLYPVVFTASALAWVEKFV